MTAEELNKKVNSDNHMRHHEFIFEGKGYPASPPCPICNDTRTLLTQISSDEVVKEPCSCRDYETQKRIDRAIEAEDLARAEAMENGSEED